MKSTVLNAKVILIGEKGVGKTSLVMRFVYNMFREQYIETLGANFYSKHVTIKLDNRKIVVKMMIWDLAGDYHFRSVQESYFEGAQAAICVYDVSRRTTFDAVPHWINRLLKKVEKIPLVLVGNKIDLRKSDELDFITTDEGKELAKKLKELLGIPVLFIETSAKTGENVEKAFYWVAYLIAKIASSLEQRK